MMTIKLQLLILAPFLVLNPQCTEAQASPPVADTFGGAATVNPRVAAIFAGAIVLILLFSVFLSAFIRSCYSGNSGADGARPANTGAFQRGGRRGLDKEVLETLPTMAYSKAKELKAGNEDLECAVCLSEFTDDDELRLLPACSHVFHVDCIDVWLGFHVTCPICRYDLSQPPVTAAAGEGETASAEEIRDGGLEYHDLEAGWPTPAVTVRRWNSTGHETELVDRYTLRLPENVRKEILAAGRARRATSLAVVPDVRESSVRRGLAGRWRSFSRTLSVRLRSDRAAVAAEGSSKSVFWAVEKSPIDRPVDGATASSEGSRTADE